MDYVPHAVLNNISLSSEDSSILVITHCKAIGLSR